MPERLLTRCLPALLLALLLALAGVAQAQTDPLNPPREGENAERIQALTRASLEAFNEGDFRRAEAACRRLVDLEERSFVHWYNLACALSMQDLLDDAAEALMRSIELGFIDVAQLRRDPHLAPLRDSRVFRKITDNWSLILEKNRDANLERTKRQFRGPQYETSYDEALRLAYHAAFDPQSLAAAKAEIARIARWARDNVFPDILDPEAAVDDAWVVVVLPTRRDFNRWAVGTFGPGVISSTSALGGAYEHDDKRLVAMGLGSSLRHEFFHVLHWRDNVRHGVAHPVWVQEGLCSLVEDYDLEGGQLVPTPSWRTNAAVRLASNGNLMPLEWLCSSTRAEFHGDRPLLHYAMARTLFLYLYREGALREWYETYNQTYHEDRSGVLALEKVFGKSIREIDEDYRAWVRELEMVPEWNRLPDGFVQLGLAVNPGSGEGPVVEQVATREARRAGFRPGDVITAINERPTRDVHELLRVLNDYEPGDRVTVSYRRRGKYRERGGHETAELVLQRRME